VDHENLDPVASCPAERLDAIRRPGHDLGGAGQQEREGDREHRPLTDAGAVGVDRSTVELDEVTDDRQAQPEPSMAAPESGVPLTEALEDVGQNLRRNALTRVADADLDQRVDPLQPDLHTAVPWRELNGVREKVPAGL